MGACLTLEREEGKARKRSEEIDRQLGEFAKQQNNVIKILLLGAGESGKSTLVKQMKIIHADGFTHAELSSFRPTVLDNLLASMKYVLAGMGILRINLEHLRNKIHAQNVLVAKSCFDMSFTILPAVAASLQALWSDRGVRLAVARGYEYELNDSALYLFENMERICDPKYVPNATDVLRARVRTQGIIETQFCISDMIVSMYDVGGQRSQRRKWIYCFDDVRAVLFVISLSGYDMTLLEDPSVNRLEESLNLFGQIVNNPFFRDASFVLFLNKFDLFREKILHSNRHLRLYFPDYRVFNKMPSLIRPLMIFGPSGSGKSTLVKKMLEEFPDKFGYSVSHTTRKPRPGEIHGIHYHFTDVETMKRAIEDGFFLESAVFSGNMYGTSKAAVDDIAKKGKVCLLEIDVQGVKQVKKSDLNPFSIFIIPPSLDELKRRLLKRNTESEESLLQRLAKAEEEIKYGTVPGNCDLVICNDDFETAYSELRHFVVENVFKNQFNTNGSNL